MEKKKPLRLTAAMARVLVIMAGGGTLRAGMSIDGRAWLDNPKERDVWGKTVSHATVWGLYKRGLIRTVGERFPTRTYGLTPSGVRAAKEAAQ